jgi:hypothetical protein
MEWKLNPTSSGILGALFVDGGEGVATMMVNRKGSTAG